MRAIIFTGLLSLLLLSCLREKYSGEDCRQNIRFQMLDVPYVYHDEEAVSYRPYYTFTEQLNLFVFTEEQLYSTAEYDYEYCKTHPVIPYDLEGDRYTALFVANLFDPKELNWAFMDGQLKTWFSIVDYEEPPVLLAAKAMVEMEEVPVEMRLLVSRLEIFLTNPPAWVTGLDLTVRNIAGSVSTDLVLGDTTHIRKQVWLDYEESGMYKFGLNTFPTYADQRALLTIGLLGASAASPILVDDNRLHLLPGFITRLNIDFGQDGKIVISVEVNGRWEVVDGGHIII